MGSMMKWASRLKRTPLHPQWLLGARWIPPGIADIDGVVLDIGAADRWIRPHLPSGVSYVALDYPTTGNKFYSARPDIFADAGSLPIADECIDCVLCFEVLEHVPDPALAIAEIARVLKPGGHAWVSMPFLYPLHNEPFDFQRYTEFGLRGAFARTGLEMMSLQRSIHAIRTAGMLMCLAIAGGVHTMRWPLKLLLLPLALMAIFATNILARLLSTVWPDWSPISAQHHLEVRKPLEPVVG